MKTRILQFCVENGEREYVVITQTFTSPVSKWQRPDYELTGDVIMDCDMPAGFPLDIALTRTLGPE